MRNVPFTANARGMGTVQVGRIPAHIHEVPIGFYNNVAWFHREASGGPGAGSVVQPGGGQGIKITGENFGSSEAFNHAKTYLAHRANRRNPSREHRLPPPTSRVI